MKKLTDNKCNIVKGDYVSFGSFGLPGKDKAPIEWQVLETNGVSALLMSRYALEYMRFDYGAYRLEDSDIYRWLDSEFPEDAFTREEMRLTEEDERGTVFLLTDEEAEQYFPREADRICLPSEQAAEKYKAEMTEGVCEWWLYPSHLSSVQHFRVRQGIYPYGGYEYREELTDAPVVLADGSCAVRFTVGCAFVRPCVRVRLK